MDWKGYRGSIEEFDLSSGERGNEELAERDALDYIGGSGLNARYFYKSTDPDTPALSPDNPFIIGDGPLARTSYLASARASINAISPITGVFGDSNGGGFFAARLKEAGDDGIIVRGRTDSPVYLLLEENSLKVEDAGDLWGLDTESCER